jgi:hypothetical protein
MQIVSRDEIRMDSQRIQIVYTMQDEWGNRLINSVVLHRPLKTWKRPEDSAKSCGAYVKQAETV